jgi:hypothetical protein
MSHALALSSLMRLAEPEVPEAIAPTSSVAWEAPPECPRVEQVSATIAARVALEAVHVRAVVRHEAEDFIADVEIDTALGSTRRRLQSPSCASIVDALALLAQVAADPLPSIAELAPAPTVPPSPEPLPEPVTEPLAPTPIIARETEPPTRPARRGNLRARIFAHAVFGGGTLPGVDLGVRGGVGLTTRRVHADVGALYLGPRTVPDVREDVVVSIDAWAVFARVCPVVPLGLTRLELSICAVATAGQLRGTASGDALLGPGKSAQPWLRIAAAPELGIVVHPRVRLVAAVEAGGHVVRPGFAIVGLNRVWAPHRWAVHGLLGLEVRLP